MAENTISEYEIEEVKENRKYLIDSDGFALISFNLVSSDGFLSFNVNNHTNEYIAIVLRDRLNHVLSVNLLEGYKSIKINKVNSFTKKPKNMVVKRPDNKRYTHKCNWWLENNYKLDVYFLHNSEVANTVKTFKKLDNCKIRYNLVSESEAEEIKKMVDSENNSNDSDEESDDPGGFNLFDDSDEEDGFQKPEPEPEPEKKNQKKIRKPCEPFNVDKNPINFRGKHIRQLIEICS